jgi:prolipoprotein diacylglyceryltransferase
MRTEVIFSKGVGLGNIIAVAISWSLHKGILWAILHGILGWLYVIWYAVTR